MADEQPRDGQEWQFRLRAIEEKAIRLQEQVMHLVANADSDRRERDRVADKLDDRFEKMEVIQYKIQRTVWMAVGALIVLNLVIRLVFDYLLAKGH